jgi:hypothetical protein
MLEASFPSMYFFSPGKGQSWRCFGLAWLGLDTPRSALLVAVVTASSLLSDPFFAG